MSMSFSTHIIVICDGHSGPMASDLASHGRARHPDNCPGAYGHRRRLDAPNCALVLQQARCSQKAVKCLCVSSAHNLRNKNQLLSRPTFVSGRLKFVPPSAAAAWVRSIGKRHAVHARRRPRDGHLRRRELSRAQRRALQRGRRSTSKVFELEAELFLQCRKNRREPSVRVWSYLPLELQSEIALEAGVVHNGTTQ